MSGKTNPGSTSKSKKSIAVDLGVPYEFLKVRTISWVPMPLTSSEKSLLLDVCKVRKIESSDNNEDGTEPTDDEKNESKIHALLSHVLTKEFKRLIPEFEKETESLVKKEVKDIPIEKMEEEMIKIQKRLELMKSLVDERRKK